MNKLRILFVDDEGNVLSGIRRLLRSMRNEWDLGFAGGGEEALRLLDEQPYDVIVSDMKMPVMNGAELLREVKRRHPSSVRIVLSGHSDADLTMQAVGPTHQFLAKPCDPDELKATIGRIISLKEMLSSDRLNDLVSGIDSLPSLPEIYNEITACLEDPDASLQQIAGIIGKDVGMSAKILQLSNSAFFGIGRQVLTIEEAVSFLGLETISTLVLGHGVFSQYDEVSDSQLDIGGLWNYSLRSAAIAKRISRFEGLNKRHCNEAEMAAMLHEVGRIVFALGKPDMYAQVVAQPNNDYAFDDSAVVARLGTTLAGLGAYLLGLWGLPERVVEAVAYHDQPGHSGSAEFDVLGVVHVASRLAAEPGGDDPSVHMDAAYLEQTGKIDRMPGWVETAEAVMSGQDEAGE